MVIFKILPCKYLFFSSHSVEQFGHNLMGFAWKSSIVKTRLLTISSVIWVSMNLRDSNAVDTTPVVLF